MVRTAVSGRNARKEPPAGLGADARSAALAALIGDGRGRQERTQSEHGPARRRILRSQSPGDAADCNEHNAHTCRQTISD